MGKDAHSRSAPEKYGPLMGPNEVPFDRRLRRVRRSRDLTGRTVCRLLVRRPHEQGTGLTCATRIGLIPMRWTNSYQSRRNSGRSQYNAYSTELLVRVRILRLCG